MSGRPFCWVCSAMLQIKNGGGYYFAIVKDQDGVEHKVHHECKKTSAWREDLDQTHAARDVRKAFCSTGCQK
jgi:hypothetical protein